MDNYLAYSDKELFALLKLDDEGALAALFERYRDRLYYYLLRHTKSPEVSEEIVLDIFMKLWHGRALADQIDGPAAFFHKVGYYKAMDFLRTASRHSRLREAYINRVQDTAQKTPADLLIDDEAKEWLLKAINQLTPQRKLVYQLSREDGLSHEEIASLLKLSKSTVNNTIVAATRSVLEFLRNSAPGRAALSVLWLYFI